MKDAKGHGSNSKGVAKAAGYSVERRPPLGYFIRTPAGAEHGPYFKEHGAWKDAANLSKPDAAAQLREGSGSKSNPVATHDAHRVKEAEGSMSRLRDTFKQGDNKHGEYGRNVREAFDRHAEVHSKLTGKPKRNIYD